MRSGRQSPLVAVCSHFMHVFRRLIVTKYKIVTKFKIVAKFKIVTVSERWGKMGINDC